MKLTKHAYSFFLHSAIDLFEIRIWKKARKLLHPYQHRSSERMNIVFHHRGCGQNSMGPDRQIHRMSLCFPHCCDSKGEKVYEKVFLSLNNLSISFTCVETVI